MCRKWICTVRTTTYVVININSKLNISILCWLVFLFQLWNFKLQTIQLTVENNLLSIKPFLELISNTPKVSLKRLSLMRCWLTIVFRIDWSQMCLDWVGLKFVDFAEKFYCYRCCCPKLKIFAETKSESDT